MITDSLRLRRWRAATVAILVAGYAGYYLCRSNLSVCLPLIASDLTRQGLTAAEATRLLGSIASIGILAYALGKFFSGGLADWLGGKRTFLLGMGGSVACTLLFALSGAPPLFLMAWSANRAVQSMGWAGMVKTAAKWVPYQAYGTVMGIVSLSYLFGDALARSFMGQLLRIGLRWNHVFFVAAAVLASLFVLSLLVLRDTPLAVGEPEPEENPASLYQGDADAYSQTLPERFVPLLTSLPFGLVCLLSFGATILRETFLLWTPTYFVQIAHMQPSAAASASALFPLFGGFSVLLCGWLSDRLGQQGRALILLSGLALASVALALLAGPLAGVSPLMAMVLVSFIAFLVLGPYSFLAGAIALDFGGKRGAGTASGLIDGVGYLGGVLAGDGMARLLVRTGWNQALLVLAGVALLSSLTGVVYWRQLRSRAPLAA